MKMNPTAMPSPKSLLFFDFNLFVFSHFFFLFFKMLFACTEIDHSSLECRVMCKPPTEAPAFPLQPIRKTAGVQAASTDPFSPDGRMKPVLPSCL
jgi:hypothetical protein